MKAMLSFFGFPLSGQMEILPKIEVHNWITVTVALKARDLMGQCEALNEASLIHNHIIFIPKCLKLLASV